MYIKNNIENPSNLVLVNILKRNATNANPKGTPKDVRIRPYELSDSVILFIVVELTRYDDDPIRKSVAEFVMKKNMSCIFSYLPPEPSPYLSRN